VKSGPRPAREFLQIAVRDDAEAAVIAGALLHSAERIVEGVAVVAESERQSLPIELRTQAANVRELVQGGRQRLRQVRLRIAAVAGACWAESREAEKRE
jgi:hypothetical protein